MRRLARIVLLAAVFLFADGALAQTQQTQLPQPQHLSGEILRNPVCPPTCPFGSMDMLTQATTPAKKKIFLAKMNPFQAIDVHSHAFHEVTAQFAHVGAGYGVVTGMRLAGHNTIGISGMAGFTLVKEFWYDRKYEKQNLKENLRDAGFYGLGIGIAILQGSLKR